MTDGRTEPHALAALFAHTASPADRDSLVRRLAFHHAYYGIIRGVVHGINNHLQGVRFGVPFLTGEELEQPPPMAKLRELVGTGTEQTLTDVEALSQLLTMGHVSASGPVAAGDVVDRAVGWAIHHRHAAHTQLSRDVRPGLPAVAADPFDITCALSLLINNAIETTAHLPSPTVSVDADRDPGAETVTLRVRDNGPGIVEAARTHLFEPGFTTTPGREGLGLAFAEWLVTRHGGAVTWVESAPETTFAVSLLPH